MTTAVSSIGGENEFCRFTPTEMVSGLVANVTDASDWLTNDVEFDVYQIKYLFDRKHQVNNPVFYIQRTLDNNNAFLVVQGLLERSVLNQPLNVKDDGPDVIFVNPGGWMVFVAGDFFMGNVQMPLQEAQRMMKGL